jgi:hypothetical protein
MRVPRRLVIALSIATPAIAVGVWSSSRPPLPTLEDRQLIRPGMMIEEVTDFLRYPPARSIAIPPSLLADAPGGATVGFLWTCADGEIIVFATNEQVVTKTLIATPPPVPLLERLRDWWRRNIARSPPF